MAEIDLGEPGFSVVKTGSADLFDENGRPSLSTSRDRSIASAPMEAPAAEPASEPTIDLDAPVKEIETRLAQLQEQPLRALPTAPTPPGPKPDRYSYTDPDAYDRALLEYGAKEGKWRAEQYEYDAAKQQLDQHQAVLGQAQFALYNSRRQRAMARHPDYVQLVERPDLPVTPAMAHAAIRLHDGAELMYWLAQAENKPEAERLARIQDPAAVLIEMGRLAQSRTAVKPAQSQSRPQRAAPAPVARPREAGEEDMNTYAARRSKELAAERRPGMFGGR